MIQQTEHYFATSLDRKDIVSRESHIAQHWLPLEKLEEYDLRPKVVKDSLADGSYLEKRYLIDSGS